MQRFLNRKAIEIWSATYVRLACSYPQREAAPKAHLCQMRQLARLEVVKFRRNPSGIHPRVTYEALSYLSRENLVGRDHATMYKRIH
jgi:hypothetical protein